MPIKFHSGANLESCIGSTTMASTSVSTTTTGITSATFTAPNTTNSATGVTIYQNSRPNPTTVYTVELLRTGSPVASATVNGTDILEGYLHARFTTPHTFTTTAAGAYAVRITSTLNSGSLAIGNSGFWFELSYDDHTSPALNDDIIHCGWHDSGLTAKQWTITGTSTVFGSGAAKGMGGSTNRTMGAALMIGQGGTVRFDDTADCTVEVRGSIFITRGGVFDKRANTSDIEIVSKLIFDCETANANYGFHMANNYNGVAYTDGMEVSHRAQYASGVGTAANPIVTSAAHNFRVNDEVIIPGLTYNGNQIKYVISIPNATQLVVSDTIGGAESAITNTPAAGVWIGNLTRNSVITSKTTTRGYYIHNNGNWSEAGSTFNYTRFEYASCNSGFTLQFSSTNEQVITELDGIVGYYNSAIGRNSATITGVLSQTVNNCILLDTLGTNYAGQSGMVLSGASNKTINRLMLYAAPGSTSCCAGLSLTGSSTNNTINDSHFYGGTANNGSLSYAVGILLSHGNTFNNCTINNSRVRGILNTDGFDNNFNNCSFGTVGSNTVDIFMSSDSLATQLYNNCNFGSATRLSNVQNALAGTDIAFQDIDGNTAKHGWETPFAQYDSSGAGLADTTTRTPGSLALAIKPRNAVTGSQLIFKIPANPASNVQVYGYVYRNATFSSGDVIAELFLPGTLLTDTPDDTFTLSTTTEAWQLWKLSAYYSGSVARYARVRLTGKTSTAGAYMFLDDIYDAQTNNKVAGMDLWDIGHISPIMLALDLSALPEQTRVAVWSDSDTYSAGEKGKVLADTEANTDLTQAKVDQL
jgi:hypothetical protein